MSAGYAQTNNQEVVSIKDTRYTHGLTGLGSGYNFRTPDLA